MNVTFKKSRFTDRTNEWLPVGRWEVEAIDRGGIKRYKLLGIK